MIEALKNYKIAHCFYIRSEEDDDKRFIGLYRAPWPEFIGQNNMDLVHAQGEFIKTVNGF